MKTSINPGMIILILSFIFSGPPNSTIVICHANDETEDDGHVDPEIVQPEQATQSSSVRTVIRRDFLSRLPNADELYVAFNLAPGVCKSGDIRVHGGAINDNVYLVDGIDTTDPLTSTMGLLPYADTVDSVEILIGAFPAEYGRSMGGIIKTTALSPGNDFHGNLRYKIANSSTRSSNEWSEYRVLPEYDYSDYAATITGPLIRDKLWFMVSFNYNNQDGSDRCQSGYWADPASRLKTVETDKVRSFPSARLIFEPHQDHRIVCMWSLNSYVSNNNNITESFSGYGETYETLHTLENSQAMSGATWSWQVNPKLVLETNLGGVNMIEDDKPTSENDTDPGFFDTYSQQYYNNSGYWTEEDRTRMQCGLTADYRSDDVSGSHQWKSGIEYHRIESEKMNKIPGGAYYSITQTPVGDSENPEYFTGMYATRTTLFHPGSVTASGDYYAFFIQDDWSVTDRITLNLGVRFENMVYKNDAGETDIPGWRWGDFTGESYLEPGTDSNGQLIYRYTGAMEFDRMIAPRAGAVWDIFGTGKSTVHAFLGRYYDPFDLSLPGRFQPFESDPFTTRVLEYLGPEWTDRNKDGIPDEDYFYDYANWETGCEPEPEPWNMIDPDLKPEYTDEFSIGFRQELMPDVSVGIVYTNRKTRDMIEDVGLFVDDDGNVRWTWRGGVKDDFSGLDPDKKYDPRDTGSDYAQLLYWITNVKGNRRDYEGLEISATIDKPDWDLLASYTLSKTEGSVTEEQPGYSGISQFSGHYDTFQTSQNLYGELPWSCRHYVKLAGSYHFDLTDWYELSFGINSFIRSGYFISKRETPHFTYDPDKHDNDINDPQTWTGKPPYRSNAWTYPEGRGGYELPSYYSIDVSLQNTFRFGKFGAATVILDVENATDNQNIVNVSEVSNPNVPHLFGQQYGWGTPREYRLSLKYSF